MGVHRQWRDCQEWRRYDIELGTTSNEAAKLYDAAVTQYTGWLVDEQLGGLSGTLTKMKEADPNFVMTSVLGNAFQCLGTAANPFRNAEFETSLTTMMNQAKAPHVTDWERQHATAVNLYAHGKFVSACQVWEQILLKNPLDMLALKLAYDGYFYAAKLPERRDSVARVIPHWKPSMPLYGYLHGLQSFALLETNFYDQAEKAARKGLEIEKSDSWAAHALAHVLEHQGRAKEGISFMSSSEQEWQKSSLSCHNYWHWGLYHIEQGAFQKALDIYDSELLPRIQKTGGMFELTDSSSLLLRLEMEGINVGARWNDLYEYARPNIDAHFSTFTDVHIMLALLGSKHRDTAKQMMESIEDFIRDCDTHTSGVLKRVGQPMCEAFMAYDEGDYARAVDTLMPVRYDIVNIGGSHAQKDAFNILLIDAALKSTSKDHNKLAKHLLVERKAMKENSPLTDRMMARALATHDD